MNSFSFGVLCAVSLNKQLSNRWVSVTETHLMWWYWRIYFLVKLGNTNWLLPVICSSQLRRPTLPYLRSSWPRCLCQVFKWLYISQRCLWAWVQNYWYLTHCDREKNSQYPRKRILKFICLEEICCVLFQNWKFAPYIMVSDGLTWTFILAWHWLYDKNLPASVLAKTCDNEAYFLC